METKEKRKFDIDWILFLPPAIILGVLVIWGLIDNDSFSVAIMTAKDWVLKYFSSTMLLVGFAILAFVVFIAFSPAGKIRFGGKDAKPEFTNIQWFAMSLCAGIAIGIVFWGVAEPMTFFMSPPAGRGVEAGTPEAATWAMSQSYMHWTFVPYAFYVLIGMGIAYATYNKKLPFNISSVFHPIIGDRIYGPAGKGIDILCIFATIGANAPSLVFGTQQLTAGLNYKYGVPATLTVWIIVVIIITITFTISSYTGIRRGIKFLSRGNFYVYITLIVFVAIAGPTVFILGLGVEATGDFLGRIVPDSLITDPFHLQGGWVEGWTAWYWAWWLCGAPINAMFLARVAKGRTIREFIICNLVCTAIFGIIWFMVFGGTAIYQQYEGIADIWSMITEKGNEVALFALFDSMPLAGITIPLVLIAIFVSFVTLADSMTTSLSIMTSKLTIEESQSIEPPTHVKLTWGILMGGFAIVILMTGIGSAVQTSAVLMGLPITFMFAVAIVAVAKALFAKKKDSKQDMNESGEVENS